MYIYIYIYIYMVPVPWGTLVFSKRSETSNQSITSMKPCWTMSCQVHAFTQCCATRTTDLKLLDPWFPQMASYLDQAPPAWSRPWSWSDANIVSPLWSNTTPWGHGNQFANTWGNLMDVLTRDINTKQWNRQHDDVPISYKPMACFSTKVLTTFSFSPVCHAMSKHIDSSSWRSSPLLQSCPESCRCSLAANPW